MAEDGALKRLAVVLGLVALAVMLAPGFLVATIFVVPLLAILGLGALVILVLFGGPILETVLTAKKAWTVVKVIRLAAALLTLPLAVLVRALGGRSGEGGKESS